LFFFAETQHKGIHTPSQQTVTRPAPYQEGWRVDVELNADWIPRGFTRETIFSL